MTTPGIDPSRLLPRPQRIEFTHGTPVDLSRCAYEGPIAGAAARLLGCKNDAAGHTITARAKIGCPANTPGEYTVLATGDGVDIRAADEAGVRHALASLAQIRALSRGGPCAAFRIEDSPSFPVRGLMLDISRCRVPTMDSLFALVDELETLKYNHLQLYTEHTFAYSAHEAVWHHASPMTHEQVRALDAYAHDRGIELCPNQNTLGHLERWFEHDEYLQLAEITDRARAWTFETDDGRPIDRTGPFSLCATDDRAVAFAKRLLDELLPCFSSCRVNIGLDEALDLGQGRSAALVKERGRAAIFGEYMRDISGCARAHGRDTLFWADMLLRHPETILSTPEGSTALVWGYEADAPFAQQAALLRERGIDHWVCPGTSSWRSIIGRTSARLANTANASAAGAASGATGFLLTDWGDLGHRQHWPIALHSIRMGAQAAWDSDNPAADPRAAGGQLGAWIDALGDLDAPLRTNLRNAGAIFTEYERPLSAPLCEHDAAELDAWAECADKLDDFRANMPDADELVTRELGNALDSCEVGVRKAIARREAALAGRTISSSACRSIAELARYATDTRRALWCERAREGGLDESLGYDLCVINDLLNGAEI